MPRTRSTKLTRKRRPLHSRSRVLGKIPPVELVVFLCYGRSMKETKDLNLNIASKYIYGNIDDGIYQEVVKILKKEKEKQYWASIKSLNKKKKGIKRNGRKKSLF